MNFSPFMLVSGTFIGLMAAFFAYRRGKNPFLWFTIGFLFGLIGVFAFFFWGNKKKEISQEPSLTIYGPSDKFWYFLDGEKKPQGPLSLDALRNNWKTGKLDQNTYVWHDGLTEWKQIKETLKAEV